MPKRMLLTVAACLLVAVPLVAVGLKPDATQNQTTQNQSDERVIVASVVDGKGEPVLGLTARDFIVREDGQTREVLSATRDESPLQIALLVDNSVEMRDRVADLRRALTAFVKTLRPGVELSVITLGERPTIVAPYTSDKAALHRAVNGIMAFEAGNYVLDAIAEVSEGLAKRPNARSLIAVVSGRGPEYSYREYTDVLRIVRNSGTPALHAMMFGGVDVNRAMADLQVYPSSTERPGGAERDIVLGRLTNETGGRYEEVLSMSALTTKLQQMSHEISNQYRVTFARPQRLVPPKNTEIFARDPKLKARGRLEPIKH
jgi:VWFA-related protein